MSGNACVVFDPSLTDYDFGAGHPMAPIRVDLTMRLATDLGLVGGSALATVPAPMASDELLATVHDPAYLAAVEEIGKDPYRVDEEHGLGTADNPTFEGMHQASAHIVGATVEAARRVWTGEALHAANVSGGLHHAMPGKASGFCVYNDVAVGIRWLLDHGAQRVAYVDVDVHHGDGVERIFYDDPRVLTISLHETGQMLFPGTGFPKDVGGPGAEGSAVNVALPPGTSDAGWLRAFHAVVPPLLREFAPDILVTQQGCDSHIEDPLAHLMLTVDGQRASYLALHDLAHELCGGRWLATGGGGYAVVDVVPRAWAHLLGIVGGMPVDPLTPTPEGWREHIRSLLGRTAPMRMTDGRLPAYRDWSEGYDPSVWLDRAIHATREAVFPLNGLDPMP
ncbi:acetoin utilization protein AcuC [Nocardioides mesophilus]|uniref:Acetoin utilization protein AcuC n=1 Tax=Nocardioides mesophilus TaxID=433659 RepID=A0A7G9R6M0_9ACTN|nr:acetoin utilization protein AcuC [Nocardioides mesophilus]QNN51245.1 acetoin utilization protein AcuC [Nocardioides mesophilus]